MVHGFGSGTFFDVIQHQNILFQIHAAMDTTPHGRNLMQTFATVKTISSDTRKILTYIDKSLTHNILCYYVTVPAL